MDLHQGHTPPPDPQAPVVIDTTTPAEGIVSRFTQADWPRYANWLGARVSLRWPHIPEHRVPQMLTSYMSANDSAIFKTDEVVSLVTLQTMPFEARPIARQVFLFTNGHQARPDAVRLVRELALWAKRLGASKLILDNASDFTPGKLKHDTKAKEEATIYLDLIDHA